MISVPGDAQSSQIVLSGTASGAGSTLLLSGGSSIAIPVYGVIGFEAHFVASNSVGTSTFLKFEGAAKNWGGTSSFVDNLTTIVVAEDVQDLHQVKIGISVDKVTFTFTNYSDLPSNAVCYVRYTQTTFP